MDIKGVNPEYVLPQHSAWQELDIKKKSEPTIKPIEKTELGNLKASGENEEEKLASKLKKEELARLSKETKEVLEGINQGIKFTISKETGDIVVQVINRKTQEIIRQIPPEDLIKLRAKLKEICGLLFDKKA